MTFQQLRRYIYFRSKILQTERISMWQKNSGKFFLVPLKIKMMANDTTKKQINDEAIYEKVQNFHEYYYHHQYNKTNNNLYSYDWKPTSFNLPPVYFDILHLFSSPLLLNSQWSFLTWYSPFIFFYLRLITTFPILIHRHSLFQILFNSQSNFHFSFKISQSYPLQLFSYLWKACYCFFTRCSRLSCFCLKCKCLAFDETF